MFTILDQEFTENEQIVEKCEIMQILCLQTNYRVL